MLANGTSGSFPVISVKWSGPATRFIWSRARALGITVIESTADFVVPAAFIQHVPMVAVPRVPDQRLEVGGAKVLGRSPTPENAICG